MRKTELENKVASLLGGRAAEEIIFATSLPAPTTTSPGHRHHAEHDPRVRHERKVGTGLSRGEKQPLFLGTGMRETGDYSEATSEMIDIEIRESITREYERALAILREKKDVLVQGARLLLEKEKVDGEEIKALMESFAAEKAAAPVA